MPPESCNASNQSRREHVRYFALHMMQLMTTVEGIEKFHDQPRGFRRLDLEQLVRIFKDTLQSYPDGDPHKLREQMGPQEFLRFVDAESEEEDDGTDEEQPH